MIPLGEIWVVVLVVLIAVGVTQVGVELVDRANRRAVWDLHGGAVHVAVARVRGAVEGPSAAEQD